MDLINIEKDSSKDYLWEGSEWRWWRNEFSELEYWTKAHLTGHYSKLSGGKESLALDLTFSLGTLRPGTKAVYPRDLPGLGKGQSLCHRQVQLHWVASSDVNLNTCFIITTQFWGKSNQHASLMFQKCLKSINKKNIKDRGHVPGLAIDFGIGGWPRAFGGVLERRSVSWAGSASWVMIAKWRRRSPGALGYQSFSSARSWSSQLSSWALRISCARSCAFGRVTLDFAQGEALTTSTSSGEKNIKTFQFPASLAMLLGLFAARRFCATNFALESSKHK